jgi:N utilization substance protein B
MASRRAIRELALQVLYLIDARGGEDEAPVDDALAGSPWGDDELAAGEALLDDEEKAAAADLARQAYRHRADPDAIATELAPAWPTARQPAVDRAILRLAWWEMASGRTPGRAAINEAIELAKHYSTERSPAFINGLLDKMMKRLPDEPLTPAQPRTDEQAWLDDALTPTPQNADPKPE